MAKNKTWEEENFLIKMTEKKLRRRELFLDKKGQKDAEKYEDFSRQHFARTTLRRRNFFFLIKMAKSKTSEEDNFFLIKMARKTLRKWGFF